MRWLAIANTGGEDEPAQLSAATAAWLRSVARQMLTADGIEDYDARRNEVFIVSGLSGDLKELEALAERAQIRIALQRYVQEFLPRSSREPAEYVAKLLKWKNERDGKPLGADSARRRIDRALVDAPAGEKALYAEAKALSKTRTKRVRKMS